MAREYEPDLILLDFRLADGGLGTTVAEQLQPFGILGILYASANTDTIRLTSADGHACMTKPYTPADLLRGLELVTGLVTTGKAELPFPKRFQLPTPRVLPQGSEAVKASAHT